MGDSLSHCGRVGLRDGGNHPARDHVRDTRPEFVGDVPVEIAVACEQQDVDEMLGNLMENAFVWCRGKVAVSAMQEGRETVLVVEDDGPGLSPDQASQAMQAGRRLDETSPGFGFGLSITRELAELYAGSLNLDRSSLGGGRATIRLPSGNPA